MSLPIARLFRLYAQAVIRAGVRQGLKSDAILAGIRGEVGRAYRRANFLEDYRRHVLEFQRTVLLGALDPEARVTDDLITDAEPRGGAGFEYRFQVRGSDGRTGEPFERFFSIASERRLTKGEATDALMESLAAGGYYADQFQVEETALDAVYSQFV